jgi:hypothetical protein
MIEVLALASAVSTISGGISSAIKAGRDVSDLLPHFGRLAKLDTEIQLAESGKHKGPLGRLTSSEEEGFAIAQAKMKHKEAMDMLRETCQLFGPPGMWDLVVREQAAARQRHKEALELQVRTLALGEVSRIGSTRLKSGCGGRKSLLVRSARLGGWRD